MLGNILSSKKLQRVYNFVSSLEVLNEPLMSHLWRCNFPTIEVDTGSSKVIKTGSLPFLSGKKTIKYDGLSVQKITFPFSEVEWKEVKSNLYVVKVPTNQKFSTEFNIECAINQFSLEPLEYFQAWKELEISPEGFKGLPSEYYKTVRIIISNKLYVPRLKVNILCCPNNFYKSNKSLEKTESKVTPIFLNVKFNVCYISLEMGTGLVRAGGFF